MRSIDLESRRMLEDMIFEAIKEAIASLPATDRHAIAAWLNELDYDDWDKQMVNDFSRGGRGNALVARVRRAIAEGRAVPFSEGAEDGRRSPRT